MDWTGQVLVKPDAEDGSLGIDHASVVDERSVVAQRVERVRETYGGSVLVEAYLPGREFNLGVIALPEPRVLPVAEVMYSDRPGFWPILTYAAKWDEGSDDDRASAVACPALIEPARVSIERAGDPGLPCHGLPGLWQGRLAARCSGRAHDPRGEPESGHRPHGRLGACGQGLGAGLRGGCRSHRSSGAAPRSGPGLSVPRRFPALTTGDPAV